jgi:hypothetical protein
MLSFLNLVLNAFTLIAPNSLIPHPLIRKPKALNFTRD